MLIILIFLIICLTTATLSMIMPMLKKLWSTDKITGGSSLKTYYVIKNRFDPYFREQVNDAIRKELPHRLIETLDKNTADILIEIKHTDELAQHRTLDYYDDGTEIKFSYTIYNKTPILIHIDSSNWLNGVKQSGLTLQQYRQYVILHEFGHALGYDHMDINATTFDGKTPIMYQATRGIPKGVNRKAGYTWNIDEDKAPRL